MKYKIGEKVQVINSKFSIINGWRGEIISTINRGGELKYGVKFNTYNEELHTLEGNCEYGYGWYLYEREISYPNNTKNFQPAKEGDVCDISGKPADYRMGKLKFTKENAHLVFKCKQCREYHYLHNVKFVSGEPYCNECVKANKWMICPDCGNLITGCGILVNKGRESEKIVCEQCSSLRENYFKCSDCGEIYSIDYLKFHYNDKHICNGCKWHWITCCECYEIVRISDNNYFDGSYYCSAHNPKNRAIYRYGYKPKPIFKGEGNLYMGVELEVDDGNNPNEVAKKIKEKCDYVYCKRDGSLGCRGIEIVSHPCTKEYHQSEFGWGKIMHIAIANGYKSHQTDTCGLHVHVNRTFFGSYEEQQDENIAKIIFLFQKFWDNIVIFSRRNRSGIEDYAKRPYNNLRSKECSCNDLVDLTMEERSSDDRYMAVNLQNNKTVEFRIFRGTLRNRTFFASLEFVDAICRFAKAHSLSDIYDISWHEMVRDDDFKCNGNLLEYLKEKKLF